MNVTLDRFGRVLIPKSVRDRLGLRSGTTLRLESHESGLTLIAIPEEPLLRDEEGVLVFTGELTGDAEQLDREIHEERIRKMAGL